MIRTALLFALAVSIPAHASELGRSRPAQSRAASGSGQLPNCIRDAGQLDTIFKDMKANSRTPAKYRKMREALASDSDSELTARLVYSETLAANCGNKRAGAVQPIADVIRNRIRVRSGNVRSVIFERDQFASSLNNYDESRVREFLCPSDAGLWRAAQESLNKPALVPTNAFNYYLFAHSTRFNPPTWARSGAVTFRGSDQIAACLRVFPGTFR